MTAHVAASSGETLRYLALASAGIVCLSAFLRRADREAVHLLDVLAAETLPWSQPVWAVFYKQFALAPRVAAVLDFLTKRLADEVLDA